MYIGIDIGGTNTRIGVFASLEQPDFELVATFPTAQEYEQQLEKITGSLPHRMHLAGIGISIAGRVAKDGQTVIVAPNLPAYVGRPLLRELAEWFACPVWMAHDAVCGLLGEKKFGVLRAYERCAYLTVSTGTGAAIQLAKGPIALTSSIEIGHQILDGNERVCLCGQVGCLETFTGGRQITLRYGRSPAEIHESVFWDTFCAKLALGLVNVAMLSRIDVVALSGAIVLHNQWLQAKLQQEVDNTLRGAALALRMAVLGENAPLVGAALLLEVPQDTILH